ncbi:MULTISPECIES: hypothetical protein [Brevibacillus]|uniref:hypothetical protein n=1 Tax=Brevibacillus TaxID=55080 RepID=UPI000D0F0A2F|nr:MULTISPECIES: hypothetical protein [Brevibacillus]PSJ66977.1 hypothetical protein C7J99_23120 [Brevibacillus brevis]RED27744.1 hypothetical protein DES34_10936 [Brevibacillus brevis]TQK42110.1 hypothetical protein FB479_115102 [Brevibacillus sp. AG162]VEF86781.1 Uncharacterised protein [Brevibacillus brevis]GEC88584.1 hypothetical protein BBR01nite_09150 [Brevibacillus brevis]
MSNIVTTRQRGIDLANACLNGTAPPGITQMSFGTGGHAPGDITTPVQPGRTDPMENQVAILPCSVQHDPTDPTILVYTTIVPKGTLDGYSITEAGLHYADGTLAYRMTFGAITFGQMMVDGTFKIKERF